MLKQKRGVKYCCMLFEVILLYLTKYNTTFDVTNVENTIQQKQFPVLAHCNFEIKLFHSSELSQNFSSMLRRGGSQAC